MRTRLRNITSSPGIILLALILIAFGVRVHRLDQFPLHGDESFTVQFSLLPGDELLRGIRFVEPNPPVVYYSLRGWMMLAGSSEFSSRFYSLFFGVLSVPLIYVLGCAITGWRVGLLAAAIMTVNPFQIWHSQDVRNYTLWPALTLAAWYFLWWAIQHHRRRDWLAYILLTATALMTHYYHLFVSAAESLFIISLLVTRNTSLQAGPRRRLVGMWIAAQAALAAVFAAWLLISTTTAFTSISNGSSPTLDELTLRTLAAVTIGDTVPRRMVVWLILPALTLLLAGGVALIRSRPLAARWLLLGLGVPLLGTFVASRLRPLYETRYLNQTAPFYYLIAAAGLAAMLDRRRAKPLALALAVAWLAIDVYAYGLSQFDPCYAKSPDWRARVVYLQDHQRPGDVIIQNYPDPSLAYYYHGAAPLLNLPTGYLDQSRRIETTEQLKRLVDSYQRIWLLPQANPFWDHDGTVERSLEQTTDRVWSEMVSGSLIRLYETPQSLRANVQSLDVEFESGIRLIGYRLIGSRAHPGDTLHLTLLWEAKQLQAIDYNVFTHVLDSGGILRAQQDNAPMRGAFPTSQWPIEVEIIDGYDLVLPIDLSAGDYAVEVGLYNWQTLIRQRTHLGEDRVVLSAVIEVSR